MPIYPKSSTTGCSCVGFCSDWFTGNVISNMVNNFEKSPNYKPVFIIPDSSVEQDFLHDTTMTDLYDLQKYKAWIFDGTEEEQTVGYKYIQMYPYASPILKAGDYVSFDFYNTGIKTTWFCLALNSDSEYEQIGKIRMCTNEVRFYNDDGKLIKIPCVFDNKINSEKNISLANLKYINGITTIYMQVNPDSIQLKKNQRLIFGRPGAWTAFKIVSIGIDNFMNTQFWDNTSARVLEITMEASYVNSDTDDIVNGIADKDLYSIKIEPNIGSMSVGEQIKLSSIVYCGNNVIYDKEVLWKSDNGTILSVDSSGNVSAVAEGSSKITAYLKDNENIYYSVNITVEQVPQDLYSIVIDPYSNESYGILQGDSVSFGCYLYNNGNKQLDEFVFGLSTTVPQNFFEYSVLDGNHFKIKNIHMDYDPIIVNCSSGEHSFNANILLKGAW